MYMYMHGLWGLRMIDTCTCTCRLCGTEVHMYSMYMYSCTLMCTCTW